MAGFTDTIRGDGLARIHRALDRLEGDPLALDYARMRFSRSPPPYTSNPSGTTTRSPSPAPPSEEQRQVQREIERQASLPSDQFSAQTSEEQERIFEADLNGTRRLPVGASTYKIAHENVKNRWVKQGIWNNKWNEMAAGRWKHEEPLELESDLETDLGAESPPRPFSFGMFLKQPETQRKPRRPKSDDEKRRNAEQRVIREREREASRPNHQFVYQISEERERIQDESKSGDGTDTADINTGAYENVKNTWTKRGIWNGRWGILPGMSWKHEKPLEQETADGPGPIRVPSNPLGNDIHEAGEAPTIRIFGSPSLIESNHRQASGVTNSSQQGLSADIDSAGLENGNAERSPSASNSPRPRTGKRVLRPSTGQTLPPSKRKPSNKDEQTQPRASISLGPLHSSKISKAAGKKRPGPRRRPNASQEVSSGDPPLLSGPDITEPLPQTAVIPPRRSKRIQPPEPSVAEDPAGIASTDSLKGVARSRPKRNVASNPKSRGLSNPQGISKKQRTTRRKVRKDDN